jgi:hypothetical protein
MIGENVDLVAMITFVVSNLSLEASIYQNLGFILNPRREDGEKSFGRREMGKKWAENSLSASSTKACLDTLMGCPNTR